MKVLVSIVTVLTALAWSPGTTAQDLRTAAEFTEVVASQPPAEETAVVAPVAPETSPEPAEPVEEPEPVNDPAPEPPAPPVAPTPQLEQDREPDTINAGGRAVEAR